MKKIIDGVLFDTDKMELIGTWKGVLETHDLYKGKTRYAVRSRGLGYDYLREVTEDEYKEFLGEANPDKYLELYGDFVEEA